MSDALDTAAERSRLALSGCYRHVKPLLDEIDRLTALIATHDDECIALGREIAALRDEVATARAQARKDALREAQAAMQKKSSAIMRKADKHHRRENYDVYEELEGSASQWGDAADLLQRMLNRRRP